MASPKTRTIASSLTPQSVRYVNELRALNVLFREGGMSRAALARQLNLNRSTTGNIIANLLNEGLVAEHQSARHLEAEYRTGRPGIVIELQRMGATFVGAEIGVDRLTVLAIDLRGDVLDIRGADYATARHSPEEAVAQLGAMARDILPAAGARRRIGGFGVAIPALLDRGTVREALHIGWRDVKLAALLRQEMQRELGRHTAISIENDANALALAETYAGTSGRSDTVAFFLIESGAGGGIVIGGELFRGAHGVAAEFGHLHMGGDGYGSNPGRKGSLESYIGKAAVLSRYAERSGNAAPDLDSLLDALERGEPAARATAEEWGGWLTRGLLHVVNVLNPGLVIIGGSVGALFAHVSDDVQAGLARELPEGFPAPNVELSRLGPEGAAFGSAILMHQRMFSVDQAVFPAVGETDGAVSA
ncbi:ROK family transcriptional regulator [Acetobacteraceae bacterium KSS8]|uniref:ROK family transcriptional regulator n=1 Tax=Endosaccharibacter trunci TaxID=2812733 RepID=A0ABT1W9P4_9PROT|nr:ROK family transcriptional regulator [Acetobacteraceae bacterium KSS8]